MKQSIFGVNLSTKNKKSVKINFIAFYVNGCVLFSSVKRKNTPIHNIQ